MSLKIERTISENKVQLKILGTVDEDAAFADAQITAPVEEVSLIVDGITGLNSCGTREWIKWMDTIPANVKISILQCPKVLVDQINMVEGMIPSRSVIQSVFVPFFCEKCSHMQSLLFEAGKELIPGTIPEKDDVKCEKCSSVMEMDVMSNRYFKFLKAKTAG